MEKWKRNPVIYEINTWVWVDELSRKMNHPVTLANIPDDTWDELSHLSIDAVWLMGVWERSPRGIVISNSHPGNLSDFKKALHDFMPEDNVGSPYCVRNYVVDSHLGGNEGLATARAQLARRGIRLILDYVPNHVAHDHPWVAENPGFFIRGSSDDLKTDPVTFVNINEQVFACGKDPFYPAWQDVLQVNVFHPGFREAITETVSQISKMCDGVRCDMAMLVMNDIFRQTWGDRAGSQPATDFWEMLIPGVRRSNPDFLFIAEAYWEKEWALQQQGFDYCYDKRLYDRVVSGDISGIKAHLSADTGFQSRLIRFTENHDEPRQASEFPSGMSLAAAMVTYTVPGARLFHEGQFEGRKTKLPVFLSRRPDEPVDHQLSVFFLKLTRLIHSDLFRNGYWQQVRITGWSDNMSFTRLIAWCWCCQDERVLIVVNYSGQPAQGRVAVPGDDLAGSNWRLYDPIAEVSYERNGDEMHDPGLFVSLSPWQFHCFTIRGL